MAFIGPIGTPEIIIILIVLLLLFGAKRLPEMGRSLGRGMREFKDSVSGIDDTPSERTPVELPSATADSDAPAAESKSRAEREPVS